MSFVLGLWDLNAICSKLSCANFAILKIKHIVPEKLKFYYQIKSYQIKSNHLFQRKTGLHSKILVKHINVPREKKYDLQACRLNKLGLFKQNEIFN